MSDPLVTPQTPASTPATSAPSTPMPLIVPSSRPRTESEPQSTTPPSESATLHAPKSSAVFEINLSHPTEETAPKRVPLLSVQMVSKTYGDDPLEYKNLVLKNIYLEIFEGEFLIIFGPSGSGKSTILNLLAGLETPTGGRVLIRDEDLSRFGQEELSRYHRLRMGMVFQTFNLIKSLNVWENVALPQTASGVSYRDRFNRAMKVLKVLHIDHYAFRHPNEISGGEQQRVAIARALINNPYFLLVDEPTGNLDTKSADDVMDLLYDLNVSTSHTIVLVTHNPNHLHYATRVAYIEDGKIIIEEKRDRDSFVLNKSHAPEMEAALTALRQEWK